MNIWNICATHDPVYGGLYRGVNDFASALDAAILSFDDGRRDRSGLDDQAVRIHAGRGLLSRDCHTIGRAAAERAEDAVVQADLLVVHSLFRGHTKWAAGWAWQHRKPFWAVPHGCLDPCSLKHRALAKRTWLAAAGRRYLAKAERVIFSTKRGLEKAAAWVRPESAVAVHWPVELPRRAAAARPGACFRQRHGIPSNAPVLLFLGRLHSIKRPIHAVKAFCRAEVAEAHLVIVGADDDVSTADVVQAVPDSCRDAVHIAGPLAGDALAEAYSAVDGFLSLSYQENFGYAAADAVAHGLPVILSPGHDLAYDMPKVAGGRLACGWLLPDDSLATAAQAIGEWAGVVRGNERGVAQMRNSGMSWAAETLAPERFREALRRLF